MKKYKLKNSKGDSPLYAQVKEILLKDIQEGVYKEKIPTEKELQEMFDVSRMTIRLAVDELVSGGYLVRERAKGTRILQKKIEEELNNLGNISSEFRSKNINYNIQYIEISIVKADEKIADALEIDQETNVFCLKRIYYVDEEPFCSFRSYFSPKLNMSVDESKYQESLYEYLENEKDIIVSKAHDDIEVGYADQELSEDLQITPGTAVLLRTRKSFDQNGHHVEYTLANYRADRYKYSRVLTKKK